MKRFFSSFDKALRGSVLVRTAVAMSVLAILSFASIVISTLIADDISGRANAVNVSGSLRMLSNQILSEVLQPDRRAKALETVNTFEQRLLRLERFVVAKSPRGAPSVGAVQAVVQRWTTQIRELELNAARGDPSALKQVVHEIPDFVEQIDRVVYLIEIELENKARLLRLLQLGLLALIVLVSLLTVWLLHRQLVRPLSDLLQAARTVSQGSFSARVRHVGPDELGQVGQAFNTMVTEIASMYAHMEDKVDEKTTELRHTNESLELLYRVSQQLSASDLTIDNIQEILREVEATLGVGHGQICFSDNGLYPAHRIASDLTPAETQVVCENSDCRQCFERAAQSIETQAASGAPMVAVPIGEGKEIRGILPILIPPDTPLTRDKARIVETVGHDVANALINMRRAEEKHRMAVLEERAVIARELHDSIAQSLSYLRIQVTRLEKCIEQGCDVHAIAEELKHGLAGAYRELRELITTFRLRIDERGFNVALQETIVEFSDKLGFPVYLENRLSGILLSGNEEMHVIRIIREALSNIERHAEASDASVRVTVDALQSVTVRIADNGKGFDPRHTPANHFGVNIMHDRAQILGGRIEVDSAPERGTTITMQFLPHKLRQEIPEPT